MGVSFGRLLPVILVLALAAAFAFAYGCIQISANETAAADAFGAKADALNARIAAAASASDIASLGAEVSALKAEAQTDSRLSSYLALLDAQNATLDMLEISIEFDAESASIASAGIDCGKDYSQFISRLQSLRTKRSSTVPKINDFLAAHPNSTAGELETALQGLDPDTLEAYAEMLGAEAALDCPPPSKPAAQYQTPLTKEEATRLLANEFIKQNDYYAYAFSDGPLKAGTNVTSVRGDSEFVRTLDKDQWFFFVDTDPFAPYEHDTFFVFVDPATAEFTVTNESYFPIINGIAYLASMGSRLDSAWRVYPDPSEGNLSMNLSGPVANHVMFSPLAIASVPYGTPVPLADAECCKGVGSNYAIIMSGYDDPVFDSDTTSMYEYLRGQGYSDGDITYLTTKAGTPKGDGITTLSSVQSAFAGLAAKADCCDTVFVYLAGHGKSAMYYQFRNKRTGETRMVSSTSELSGGSSTWRYTGVRKKMHRITANPFFEEAFPDGSYMSHGSTAGGRMTDADFDAMLDGMKSCHVTVMYMSCYSGVASGNLKGPGRTIITPVGDNPAYGATGDVAGYKAGGFFTQDYIKAKTDPTARVAADKNNDHEVSDKEAFDWAKQKAKDFVSSRIGKDNTATWTDPEKCRCCHVVCDETTDLLCKVAPGNGTDCADCSYVGEYCGPDALPPQKNETPPTPGNATGNQTAGNQTEGNITAVCGDGRISGSETCDHGSYTTNKCPEGTYCNKCGCKKLETSVVCGDGKISSPKEDCDGGSVDYKTCQPGYTCSICKCVPTQAQCGDGTVTPPEECDHGNSYTNECPGGNSCYNCRCIPPDQVPEETHKACSGSYCISVPGAGEDSCSSDAQCAQATHKVCSGTSCVSVSGAGEDQCTSDSQCTQTAPTHKACSGSKCVSVTGAGSDQCTSDAQCTQAPTPYCGDNAVNGNEACDPTASPTGCYDNSVCASNCSCVFPPTLNCEYVCSLTSGASSIASGLSTETQCMNEAKSAFPSRTCFTTCRYSYLYKVTNIAGWASCCCAMKKEFACSDCPGENPVCPAAETVCPANAPSWHSPP